SLATYYTPNNNYGACGKRIKNSEHAVALSNDKYAGGAHCGKKITAHHNGKKVVATVRDLCPGCAANSLDLTPSAFKKLAKLGKGNIAVNWKFN
ncbi:RlpA-like double-psi beta-barrel-protein domain-containing protein-containing protein, partial [Schizophyllum commune]